MEPKIKEVTGPFLSEYLRSFCHETLNSVNRYRMVLRFHVTWPSNFSDDGGSCHRNHPHLKCALQNSVKFINQPLLQRQWQILNERFSSLSVCQPAESWLNSDTHSQKAAGSSRHDLAWKNEDLPRHTSKGGSLSLILSIFRLRFAN